MDFPSKSVKAENWKAMLGMSSANTSQVNGYVLPDTKYWDTHASVIIKDIDIGIISGSLLDGITLDLQLSDVIAPDGKVRLYLANGNEVWCQFDYTVVNEEGEPEEEFKRSIRLEYV